MQFTIAIPAIVLILLAVIFIPLLIAESGYILFDRFRSTETKRNNKRVLPQGRYYI